MPSQAPTIPRRYLFAFALITMLFALWGFANDITNPMVAAFKTILLISDFESSMVQAAFYGGYCLMAIPAAVFIKCFTYKSGILMGLGLYATGCLLFIPAGYTQAFGAFLTAYFVMTCGLSFLETTANPYILSMGDPATATRRLNLAQAFNPLGSLLGMLTARNLILARLDPATEQERAGLRAVDPNAFAALQESDLSVIIGPYLMLGVVIAVVLALFVCFPLPKTSEKPEGGSLDLGPTLRRLLRNRRYVEGVIAQAFNIGVQICCWTFIIQYGVREVGLEPEEAQTYNIAAMALFVSSRFVCTYLLRFFRPGLLLMVLAVAGAAAVLGVVMLPAHAGLLCLVGASGCMSLMFPTIYGIALEGMGEDAKLAAAGLIMAIGGGSIFPPLQASIMGGAGVTLLGYELSATRISFGVPLACFVVIAVYGLRTFRIHQRVGSTGPREAGPLPPGPPSA